MAKRGKRAKRAKQTNPLGPRASRVNKWTSASRRAELPSWYYRVLPLVLDRSPFEPKDPKLYDEDLSELDEKSGQRDDAEEEESDCESERSYDGSAADLYYELKQEREERKREKLREKKARKRQELQGQKDKARQLELEKSKEEEVRAEYESLQGQTNLLSWLAKPDAKPQAKPQVRKEPTPIPLESLADQEFQLFCSDHVKYFHGGNDYEEKTVGFWQPDASEYDELEDGLDHPTYETGMLFGDLCLDSYTHDSFGPFWPPSRASRKPVKVETNRGGHEISFQFLGNGYLKLRVSRNFVFMGSDGASSPPPSSSAPREFEFVGIWYDQDKEYAERQNALLEEKRRRSPSPRESWFELNHPMGAYYTGRGWYS